MKKSSVDISVLILFFNRPDLLSQVFEQVKKARPSKLFLYQDGPRTEADMPKIMACRDIVANVDWDCEVHQLYQTKNYGCDPSTFMSHKWAFSFVDKCIVLEDDVVASVSFFSFCKEMLDKYEHDPRIEMISGMNHQEITPNNPYDYLFTSNFGIWGWASWRRVIDQWDEHYSFLSDTYALSLLNNIIKERKYRSDFIPLCKFHQSKQKAYFETIFWGHMMLNSGLAIVPTKNMINNIGATADSTHFDGSLNTMPKGMRRIFTMKRYELDSPIKHPKYVIEDVAYREYVYRTNAWEHPWIKIKYAFESLWLNLRYANFSIIWKAIKKRFSIIVLHKIFE